MPIFEYACTSCGKQYDILFKTHEDASMIRCPACGSPDQKKKMSAFAASISSGGSTDFPAPSCSSGNCGFDGGGSSPCAGGSCGVDY